MIGLRDFVVKHKDEFVKIYGIDPSFFERNIIAKTATDGPFTLKEHTESALNSLKDFLDENSESIDSFAKRNDIDKQPLLDSLFFSVFFHDLGKGTMEFYNDKILNKGKSYHPLYSIYFTHDLGLTINGIDYVTLAVLTHHTVLHEDIYSDEKFKDMEPPFTSKKQLNSLLGILSIIKNFLRRNVLTNLSLKYPLKILMTY